jgi:hypothetical protein
MQIAFHGSSLLMIGTEKGLKRAAGLGLMGDVAAWGDCNTVDS